MQPTNRFGGEPVKPSTPIPANYAGTNAVTADLKIAPPAAETEPDAAPTLLQKSVNYLKALAWLIAGFLASFFMADYTNHNIAKRSMGTLIYSNEMMQLWTACYRLTFILIAAKVLQTLFWLFQWHYYRPDQRKGPDLETDFLQLDPFHRICVYILCFFGLVFAFVLLLSVNLPQAISVVP